MPFEIQNLVLHYVDRTEESPRYAETSVSVANLPDDRRADLTEFLNNHLDKMWRASTDGAIFAPDAPMSSFYHQLHTNSENFYTVSKSIALELHTVSRPTTASAGLLLLVWLTKDDTQYLAILKIKPQNSKLITYTSTDLALAIEDIDNTLPNDNSDVEKWAIIPDPERHTYDVKFKDKLGASGDPRIYFRNFLGCQNANATSQRQVTDVIETLEHILDEDHSEQQTQAIVQNVIQDVSLLPEITLPDIVTALEENDIVVDEAQINDAVVHRGVNQLAINGNTLRTHRRTIRLSNGIRISGPWTVMSQNVTVEDGEVRIVGTPQNE